MALPQTGPITESINSLRTESSPDSVTPARVANLLQAIVDLINALSMVPDSEVTNIMELLNNAVSTANAASSAASAAQTAANNKLISQFKADAAAASVTITIKQSGHTAKSFQLPIADASQAGIVLPAVLQSITDAATAAANNKLNNINRSNNSAGVVLTFKSVGGATLYTLTLPLATTTAHGMMSKTDKQKLDALPSSGIVALDEAGRVPSENAPAIMLRNVTGGPPETEENHLVNGDFFFLVDTGKLYYVPDVNEEAIELGPPSKNVVYCHKDTNILYRWTGSQFVPVMTDPNFAMQKQEVRRNNTTQKIYSIPNGKLAQVIATTDVVNIQLVAATNGASVHRIIFYASDMGESSTSINWPNTLIWKDNDVPQMQSVTDCLGIMVTIYDMKFAEYNQYGR